LSRPRTNLDGLSGREIDAVIRAVLRDHGSVYEIDVAGIAAVAPDLVITQGICDVCAVPESQVVQTLADLPSKPDVLTLDSHDLAAIFAGIRALGRAAGVVPLAEACVAAIERRIMTIRARVAGRPRPRVLALEWLDPPYVPGHWVPEMVEAAGGDLVAGVAHRPSYRVEWAHLLSSAPDIVLVMPCGFDRPGAEREAATHRARLEPFGCPVYVLDASAYFSRSGPRVANGVEILAALLHPELAPGYIPLITKTLTGC
jgi:iron complex transport system substrate-binding protein